MRTTPLLYPSIIAAVGVLLLGALCAFGQPVPKPTAVMLETREAEAIVATVSPHAESYQLSQKFLKGVISPQYYSNALRQVMTTNAISASVKLASAMQAPKTGASMAAASVVASAPPPVFTNGLKFSNSVACRLVGIGTGNWNVLDTNIDNYYPAYNLEASTNARSGYVPIISFPEGSRGFTNNVSSTDQQQFYRVRYAQ